MEPGAEEISAGSNSSGMHSLQCSSQQPLNMNQQQKEEIQQQGEQQHQQLMQGWQQQLEDHSDQQEQFERGQIQHPEQRQLQPYVQSEHQHLEPPQLQQKQHWQPEQQQQLQMQQMLQHSQQQHLQEMHSQQQKLQQPQHQQELATQLQQQQQESPSQSEQQDMALQLQQQELPLQELALQLQQQELALQLQQQQLPPQLPQTQQQQLEQSPVKPQQQHLQQLQQSQQHLQQPQQQQQHSQNFPLQPQQQYAPQSQQQPQQSSLQPQHQHLQPLSQHQLQQLPLQPQQQHLPQPQQQTQQQLQQPSIQPQQQQLQLLSQHQQQSQQLPLQPQEQHLPQSQQKPQQQLQQSPLPSQHQHSQQLLQSQQQPSLQQAPLPSQQQHLQQLAQSQQQPQQLSLQQQQQHLQQSQQQPQQHLQQSSMSSHQQPQQQLPQPQQQLPHPQQQHLQQLPQPQKQHLQQLPQPQQQRSQALPQSQQQLQQPQPQQQRSQQLSQSQHQLQQQQLQPHLQQLSQSQQQLQQKQLQPQVQQQQQQLNNQQPSQPAVGQATTSVRGQNTSGSHSISFGSLIPMILPHLSREQSDRLQGLYTRLRRNEVTKEDFLRATRNVVGDQMLVQAVRQMQQKHQAQSQAAPSSQANQLQQQQQQQQQQRQQQHAQGSSQQFMPQQNIHTQQLNEPQPFQQVSPANLQQQTQRTSDYQPNSQSSAPATLTASHPSSDNKTQQSRQSGEQRPEVSSVHGNQTVTMNLHSVKHEVDRTMIGFPISNQQQQQHLQVPPSSFPMYGRTPGNYSSQSFSVSPGIPPSGVKALAQDSQTKQVMHSQVGVQAQGGPSQLSSIKNMPKYDLSKQSKRREDEDRQKILQSSGASHFSGQHQPSVWATSLDKEKAGNTGISPSSSVHIKQEINDNSDQQHNVQTLQPIDHGQSLISTKTESVEHQSIKTSSMSSGNLSIVNHPLGSTGVHSDHLMQAPLATSAAALHHTLSAFGGPVTGNPLQGQLRTQVPSTPPSSVVGSQIKTPPKKTLIGQKKPLEVTGPSMQLASKKQKVSAGYLDQSIDQLNDVTAVSGVNLREEEEQLFAGPKEESRATEAMRKVVQEEEERTFLQKGSLRAKLAGIMAKYGIKYISSDSERCLSLCVEERLRTMIGHLIRLSKQRVDLERVSHKVTITSDVRRQILAMNKKAKDDLEKKQAEEAEKLRKLNEIENVGPEGEKDETRTKAQKAQKEEDDKMRANAANVAARAAVGGDDMLSKWQLMAEQARQKREGTSDGASNNRTNRDANRKSVVGGLKSANVSDHQDAPSPGMVRNLGRTSGPSSQAKPVRSICIKDVIALLEREPQMTKSTLLYRLYERGVDCSKEKVTESQNNENSLQ